MSIVGVGIDLVSITDFAEQVDQPGTVFAETFTPGERRDAADKSSSAARHLAARWAAKEAVIKAAGVGLHGATGAFTVFPLPETEKWAITEGPEAGLFQRLV